MCGKEGTEGIIRHPSKTKIRNPGAGRAPSPKMKSHVRPFLLPPSSPYSILPGPSPLLWSLPLYFSSSPVASTPSQSLMFKGKTESIPASLSLIYRLWRIWHIWDSSRSLSLPLPTESLPVLPLTTHTHSLVQAPFIFLSPLCPCPGFHILEVTLEVTFPFKP